MSRLKDPKELQAMFDFAANVSEGVSNKAETYGIFAQNPKRLCVLPGVAEAFKRFLNEVEKLKPPNQSSVKNVSTKRKFSESFVNDNISHFNSTSSSNWNSRNFRNQTELIKAASEPGQTKITDYFDIDNLSSSIDSVDFIRDKVNKTFGIDENVTVQPILKLLYSNAIKNNNVTSKSGIRHDHTIKMFGAYLFCLIGRAGYEFLIANIGVALPSLPTIFRIINEMPRVKEGRISIQRVTRTFKKVERA